MTETMNSEDIVYQAIQKYLEENRIVDKTNLVNFIKSYFAKSAININEEGIKNSFESLLQKKRILIGSKLSRDTILENDNRNTIYNYITENPGANFYNIVKTMNLSNHVVFWHLSMLIKFALIRKTDFEKRELYYSTQVEEKDALKNYLYSKKKSKRIISLLGGSDSGLNKSQIARKLKQHPKTVKKYIDYLVEYGIVEAKKISRRETHYHLKEKEIIPKIINSSK